MHRFNEIVWMKKLLFFAIVCAGFFFLGITMNSCGNKGNSHDSLDSDTLAVDSAAEDSTDMMLSEAPMPKAADELFDDFIFNFASNKKLQKKRIVFPLIVKTGNKVNYITEQQWKMENFFMRQDFYTLIFDNFKQMDAVKDTSINHAIVEKIYLKNKFVKQFIFDRKNGEWLMTSINNTNFIESPNASFLGFYTKFLTDSLFQESSINDPLYFSGPDPEDDFATMEGVILPEQWSTFAPPLPSTMIYNIIYGQQGKGSNQKIFVIRGIANGLETVMIFKRIKNKWMLVKLMT